MTMDTNGKRMAFIYKVEGGTVPDTFVDGGIFYKDRTDADFAAKVWGATIVTIPVHSVGIHAEAIKLQRESRNKTFVENYK